MRLTQLFLGLFCAILTYSSNAQSDLTSWISAEAKYDLNKKWSTGLEVQSRSDLLFGKLNALFIEPSLSWSPIKYVEGGISYRLTSVPFSNETTNRVGKHRITADVNFRKIERLLFDKKSRLGISSRLRGTTEHESQERTENTLRLKFKLSYNLPKTKLDLFASTEVFYRFQRDLVYTFTEVESINAINKYRVKFGASYPMGDQHALKLFGMHQWRYPDGMNEFVIGVGYTYQFNS